MPLLALVGTLSFHSQQWITQVISAQNFSCGSWRKQHWHRTTLALQHMGESLLFSVEWSRANRNVMSALERDLVLWELCYCTCCICCTSNSMDFSHFTCTLLKISPEWHLKPLLASETSNIVAHCNRNFSLPWKFAYKTQTKHLSVFWRATKGQFPSQCSKADG